MVEGEEGGGRRGKEMKLTMKAETVSSVEEH